jgi:hypothetical protein
MRISFVLTSDEDEEEFFAIETQVFPYKTGDVVSLYVTIRQPDIWDVGPLHHRSYIPLNAKGVRSSCV